MNPITHALAGWAISCAMPLNNKERGLVTLAGIIPDIDGFVIVVDLVTRHTENPTEFWGTWHHVAGHNIALGLIMTVVGFTFSSRRWLTAMLVFISFHPHLLCDLIGARGPDGDQWPIPYLLPFSDSVQWHGRGSGP